METPSTVEDDQRPQRPARMRDDLAYVIPMAVFLAFTQVGVSWPGLYPYSYIIKTVLVAISLPLLWRHFSKISWDWWWVGIMAGIVGVVQWVGMEKLLLHLWPHFPEMSHEVFNPMEEIHPTSLRMAFLFFRIVGPVLVVPLMEELFWRDFLWRTMIAPNDFKMAAIGEWEAGPFFIVVLLFASVHNQWLTAIVWGVGIGLVLLKTRSLGACILMHAVTNLLLGVYVLKWHDWAFW